MIELRAPAKVNLTLRVGAKRGSYHPLDSVVQSVSLHDVVVVRVAAEDRVVAEDAPDVPLGDDNLALRAIRALRHAGADVPGVEIELAKRIPTGAGLGGGSADAAAALIAGYALAGEPAGVDLARVAARVGSDVPALVVGGTIRMTGRGEGTERLSPVTSPIWLLATPPFSCSTADVYRRWDDLGGPSDTPRAWPRTSTETGLGPLNDLESAAIDVQPQLVLWLDTLSRLAGYRAMVSGSGSSVFVEITDESLLPEAVADPLLSSARHLSVVRPVDHGPVAMEGRGQGGDDR